MFTVSGRLSTFTRAMKKAGECLSLKKSQRRLELPQASPVAVCDCSLPTFPASFSLPWLVSDAIPNGLHITLYSICTDTCLDKFENPCSFSTATLHILFLPEMLYSSLLPSFPHQEGLHPAKNSSQGLPLSWAPLASKKPFLPLSSPCPVTTHHGHFFPWTELSLWGAVTVCSLHLSVLGVQRSWHRGDVCVDEITPAVVFLCVCADRLEKQTEKNLWGEKPKWIHFPVPRIRRRKNRRTSWWCGIVITSGQKISVPSEKSRWAQLEAWLGRVILLF